MAGVPNPIATYRLQLNRDFPLEQARDLVPYLSRLGVTHMYSSPVLRARQESTHGYDVVDPTTLNPQLGDEATLRELVSRLQAHGMGLILDIVPNHMAASSENPYWREVLTYGASSPHARWFDIDWRLPDPQSWGRVLVPVLGEPLPKILAQDQIQLVWESGRFQVRYYDHVFPLDPATVPTVCRFGMSKLRETLAEQHPVLDEIEGLLAALSRLPRRATRLRRQVELPLEDVELWLGQLAQRIEALPQIREWAAETCRRFAEGEPGRLRLRKLLESQPYRLVYWRRAARAINYRRFFDINDLISIRQEDPEVFQETHGLIGRWIREGLLDGVRIDHLDGLRDPAGYLRRLANLVEEADREVLDPRRTAGERERPGQATRGGTASAEADSAGSAPDASEQGDSERSRELKIANATRFFYVFVEKILAHDERLSAEWPVSGTTGYEFLNQLEALLLEPDGYEEIEDDYLQLLGRPLRFKNIAAWGKRRVLRNELSAFVGRLADLLGLLARGEHRNGELTQPQLVNAIVEVAVALPVYRTYVADEHGGGETDQHYLRSALARARRTQRAAPSAVDFLQRVLLPDVSDPLIQQHAQECASFIQRFQQLTGPATAKGIEDTALYVYVPLAARNEVGGEPDAPLHDSRETLHRENRFRAAWFPSNMLSITTHDTKRTADVRARLDVLSETPRLWAGYVKRWMRINRPNRRRIAGKTAPDPPTEYLFYQSLVGLWPAPPAAAEEPPLPDSATLHELRDRLEQYMLKAAREAKTRTSWVNTNAAFEEALVAFIRSSFVVADPTATSFLSDVQQLVARIARPGFWNGLSRTLVQLTAPGTPDIYQGDELWNFALVDPDNRRPVDFELRQRLLDEVAVAAEDPDPDRREASFRQWLQEPGDGRIKLHLIRCCLHARRNHPRLFGPSQYIPLAADGPNEEHVFAFARQSGAGAALSVAPRFTRGLVSNPAQPPLGTDVWSTTSLRLPEALRGRRWTNLLTRSELDVGEASRIPLGDLLRSLPVALLVSG